MAAFSVSDASPTGEDGLWDMGVASADGSISDPSRTGCESARTPSDDAAVSLLAAEVRSGELLSPSSAGAEEADVRSSSRDRSVSTDGSEAAFIVEAGIFLSSSVNEESPFLGWDVSGMDAPFMGLA